MLKRYGLVLPVILLLLVSCVKNEKFPPITFERVATDEVKLNYSSEPDTFQPVYDEIALAETKRKLDALLLLKEYYVERDERFDLSLYEHEWTEFNVYKHQLDEEQWMEWIDATGYLLEITGNAKYAEALEDSFYHPIFPNSDDVRNLLKSFIYTKYLDRIQLNLFVNSTIEYAHSMEGSVKITQDNNYPESGKINIKFNITEHPYVKLYVRIPSWAEGATVSALSVKYPAPRGEYCRIARKWKDGDTVEIVLPVEKRTKY